MKPSSSTGEFYVAAIVGADPTLRLDAVHDLLKKWSSDPGFAGPSRFDGPASQAADVLDEVRTPSLLGDHRVVIVDNAEPFVTAHRQTLERYADNCSHTGTLILLCGSLPKNTRLYKIIAKNGKVVHCDPPKGRAVTGWIIDRASSRYAKRLGARAAEMLRRHIGDMPGKLDSELSKLSDYVGARDEIKSDDIEALTGNLREEKVFGVTDAIAGGDAAEAMSLWEQVLLTDRAAPGRAVAGLAWGVRRLLEAKRRWERGASLHELSKRLYTDPSTVKRRLERVSTVQLEGQIQDLMAADLALKTGGSTIGVAIEKFIVKHSAGKALRRGKHR